MAHNRSDSRLRYSATGVLRRLGHGEPLGAAHDGAGQVERGGDPVLARDGEVARHVEALAAGRRCPPRARATMSGVTRLDPALSFAAVLRGGGHLRHQDVEVAGQRGQTLVGLRPRRPSRPGPPRWRPGPRRRRRSARSATSPCAPGRRRAGPSSRRRPSWCRSSAPPGADATGAGSGGHEGPGNLERSWHPPPNYSGRLDPSASTYLQALRERVVIFDGAMGTNLQLLGLGPDDFGGPRPRGLQRVARRDPPRRRGPGAPVLLRGRLRRGRDRHVRLDLGRPGRVRPG